MNRQFYLDLIKQVPQKDRNLVIKDNILDLSDFIVAYGRTLEKHLRKANGINSRTTKSVPAVYSGKRQSEIGEDLDQLS